ncbi:MAG: GAF domain-containing sensor histidine kinase [Chloroflexi bacterium]|nr:GAF domain-containing sensor histidine kinase [Chloroflexota bacterium]
MTSNTQNELDGNGLHDAIRTLTSELSLDDVLQKVADLSRHLAGAKYGALGILGQDGLLERFITSGISQRQITRIGPLPQGKGVLGVVMLEGKTLRLPDLTKHPQSVGVPPHHPQMTSFLGVPIIYNGRVTGDLYLCNKIGAPEFSQEDETLVTLFAAQAAVAIENARLFGSEARRAAQLDVLNQVGREFSRVLDLDVLLQRVVDLLRERFDYQNVQIFWVDSGTNVARLRAWVGPNPEDDPDNVLDNGLDGAIGDAPKAAGHQLDELTLARLVRERKAVLSKETDPGRAVPGDKAVFKSELAVPVPVKGEVAAVIRVDSLGPNAPNVFDESDVKTLETVAGQLATAIENIQLYRQQQDQARRLAVADERDRIGRDLHDGIIQSIYAVGLTLEDIAAHSADEPEEVRPRIDGVVDDLNQVIGDMRSYIMDLRPRELQGRKLDDALESLIKYLEDRSGVVVAMDARVDLAGFSEQYVVNLWHIFQEAFSNIEKYAKASNVSVLIELADGRLILEISDDGVGFDLEKAEMGRGFGLADIKDRAERLGGILTVETSEPIGNAGNAGNAGGAGTKLSISLPMAEAGADAASS